ncbi:uncharacterized protein DS421_15g500860 [Arachis hypogaea]|nr:uncharacterized protein DS421_15g500860 [Arachis hypogaea]
MAHIAFPNTHEEGRNRPVRERAAPPVALGSWIRHLCSSVPFRGEGRTRARKGGRSRLARCRHAVRVRRTLPTAAVHVVTRGE